MNASHSLISSPAERPVDLNAEMDAEPRVIPAEDAALRRAKLIEVLEELKVSPAWKEEDHPELADGSYAWVRKLRDESERRFERLQALRNED